MYKILSKVFEIVAWIFAALMLLYAVMAWGVNVRLVIFVPQWALYAIICRVLMIVFKNLNEKDKSDKTRRM